MSLNIKNQQAHDLARKITRITGENMTAAVITALHERLERLEHEQRKEERIQLLREISKRIADNIEHPASSSEHGDMLYDERGLPN